MTDYKIFETERLWLIPMTEIDAPFFLALVNTPKWLQYIGDREVRTVEAATEYITKRMKPQLERLGFGNFKVVRKADGVILGTCGLFDRAGLDGIDIGFAFLPQYEKKGYAFEAASKMLALAKHEFLLKEVKAITMKDNIDSQRLLEKIGMKYSEDVTIPNDTEILMLYKIFL